MVSLKCKMCAGELNIKEGESVAICEYCGSKQTVPSIDDEKKVNLFARANRLRFACEFDKASSVYESIIADFPEEAEAYWGLVLCKYGIEYVDDPATSKKIPTCHRTSFESVMDDNNFEQVMENSDVASRIVYREEAKQIEELRKNIIEVSSKEEPYDIFICYKETDEDGNRTIDSVLAQDIYDELNQKGYRVFFSRITLEDKLGKEYEPFIFSALNSAKVMLVFGTSYDNFNGVWVKNEWSRFLQLISKGEKKVLIPCFKDIDAYDMPKEFAKLQAQDLGKVGATQDLIRGIEKILPKNSSSNSTKTITSEVTVDTLLERAYILLKNGDYSEANNYFNKVLDRSPKESEAYWGKLLCKEKCVDSTELVGNKKVLEYYNRCLGETFVLNMKDDVMSKQLQNTWGNNYTNACDFASNNEKKIYVEYFSSVLNSLLEILHKNQQIEKNKQEQEIIRQKKEEEQARLKKEQEQKQQEELENRKSYCSIFCFIIMVAFAIVMFTVPQIKQLAMNGFVSSNGVSDGLMSYILTQVMLFAFATIIGLIAKHGRITWPAVPVGLICAAFNVAALVWFWQNNSYEWGYGISTVFTGFIGLGISFGFGSMVKAMGQSEK